jgi:HEAT repeat protein
MPISDAAALGLLRAFIAVSVVGLVWIAISRIRRAGRRRKNLRLTWEFQDLLAACISDGRPAPPETLRRLREHPRVAREVIASIAHSLQGADVVTARLIYKQCRFLKDTIADLRSGGWYRRARGCEELGDLKVVEMVDEIARCLGDPVVEVRLAAARSLGVIGSLALLKTILGVLATGGRWGALDTYEILRSFGPAASKPVAQALEPISPPRVRRLAAELLGLMHSVEAVPALRSLLSDPDLELRTRVARALGRIGDPSAEPELIEGMKDPWWSVRAACAHALGELGSISAIPDIERGLSDRSWWVRRNSAEALGRLGSPGELSLKRNLSSPDRFARRMSMHVLREMQVRQGIA